MDGVIQWHSWLFFGLTIVLAGLSIAWFIAREFNRVPDSMLGLAASFGLVSPSLGIAMLYIDKL